MSEEIVLVDKPSITTVMTSTDLEDVLPRQLNRDPCRPHIIGWGRKSMLSQNQ